MLIQVHVMVAQDSIAYENQTQAIARQLLGTERSKNNPLSFLKSAQEQLRWDDKLMQWAMGNDELRVQLFQLIDCLPALKRKTDIARHLQEYLGRADLVMPAGLKTLVDFASPDSLPGQVGAQALLSGVEALAHKYIAGETIDQVLKTIDRLHRDRLSFTLDLLGEAVLTEAEAQEYLDHCLQLIEQLATATGQAQISVKLTAFYSQFDPLDAAGSIGQVSDRIRLLLRHAERFNCAIHFDMEQYAYKALTLTALKQILLEPEFQQRQDVGLTLQAYLRDSAADLDDLIGWAKQRGTAVTVRLIKGAYWDQETIQAIQKGWPNPVYENKAETDVNYERMTQRLLENHGVLHAAIGSHNVRSQAHAIAIVQALQIPKEQVEFQVLYGMGDDLAKAIAAQGYRVRVYCPYGALIPGMSYLIRRLLENTANTSFLRQRLEKTTNLEALIAAPVISPPVVPEPKSRGFENECDRNYAQPQAREQALGAIKTVRQQLGRDYKPYVDGQWLSTVETVAATNPSDVSESLGSIGLASIDQAEQAVQAATRAFQTWRHVPAIERADLLRRAATLMQQRRDELAAWVCLEVGKPLNDANGEVSEAIDFCNYYAAEMERLAPGVDYDFPGETNHYHYQPLGVVVVISPWNFPLAIPVGMVVAALVAGNCVILKPATTASIIAAKFTEILIEAGIPAGVFSYFPAKGSSAGNYLVEHPQVHMITFTGSQSVGCQIYAAAAQLKPGQKHLKRVVAEMGGKNAIIVDESADLDQAIQGVVHSAFGYSGQKCSACSRVIVLASIYETFLTRLIEATRSLTVGPADLPSSHLGPVIDRVAQARIQALIEAGQSQAPMVLALPAPEGGHFVGPTIFSPVPPDSDLAQNEIFGPVLAVMVAADFTEAIALANNTVFALTGGIYSRTPSHLARARSEFEVGNLYINRGITGAIVQRQPFGGFKLSGVGSKAGGPDYLLQFLEPRVVTENVQRQGFAPID
jgi:RHH-type transcriptional regulator, proline utilization regulon repressor / proline dehydrogenase / delta 1-pyrroline-5-carboxylate dehydrogenase